MKTQKINKFVSSEINKFDAGAIKVFIDTKPLKSGHAVRGVGAYTRNLLDGLKERKEIELVDKIENCDMIHYPYFDLFFTSLPFRKRKPTVITIHDATPLIYPNHYKPGIRGKIKFQMQKRSLKNVSAVITDSETSKKDIVRFLDVSKEKISVIHLAPSSNFKVIKDNNLKQEIREKYNLPDKFILYVGDVNYNKNIPGLIKAFAILANGMKLVLVGDAFKNEQLSETKLIIQLIEKLKIKHRVLMPGFIPEEDLVTFYNLATVYCQPSFYEGFGLPVLEAMACGCPVVATKAQALIEIAENAASFADPINPENLASKLKGVIDDKNLINPLIRKGLAHVKNFSWQRVAKETADVYRSVVG